MRYQRALLPTLKEAPTDAQAQSHVLLTRAGYMRRVGAGIYSYLPLGLRVLRNIERIIREEMDRQGAQELLLPAIIPADYFKETGRWDLFGETLFRLQDRKGADYLLGPTHEETITDLARREIQSYRDMPKNLYQIQAKYRDEPRPRGGLLRGREFIMKDAYSFDVSEEKALESYERMRVAYRAIFDRLGLRYRMVGADSGAMGGSKSAEFQVLVQSGEDFLAACPACEYAENLEVAAAPPAHAEAAPAELAAPELVHTPGHGSIADVAAFLKADVRRFLKSLVYLADSELVLVVLRGDHEVSEVKLARALGVSDVHLASAADVEKVTSAAVGFAGPVGFSGTILVDADAAQVADGITGANKTDHHLVHVRHGRDFQGRVVSLRNVQAGDACPRCGHGVEIFRGIEAGHIFVLGTHYTDKMGATFLDEKSEKQTIVMGCYGIGVSRLVATIVEQHHDENGINWPSAAAPYPVHIVQVGESAEVVAAVERLERELVAAGLEPLVDDRDERPGVKFKDADLIGCPYRLTVGERGLKDGKVELKPRSEPNPKAALAVPLEAAAAQVIAAYRSDLGLA
ncbi:MAG TPA: proline--tRNA ligase [Polyangiaceae bacterium]|nr:proline--tRNA ligase [Polyangiaceae bacterium]